MRHDERCSAGTFSDKAEPSVVSENAPESAVLFSTTEDSSAFRPCEVESSCASSADAVSSIAVLKKLGGRKKLQYIWDYYKLPLLGICILLYVAGYLIYGSLTEKEISLYIAFINVSMSDARTTELTDGFLAAVGLDSSDNDISLYTNLYLTADVSDEMYEYSYASEMKILAAIDGELLDIVFLNREAFDAFAQNGYLCDLEELLSDTDPQLYEELAAFLVSNSVPAENSSSGQDSSDSASDSASNSSSESASDSVSDSSSDSVSDVSLTEEKAVGLDLSGTHRMRDAEFDGEVYLCVVANTPRADTVIEYLRYFFLN